METFIIIFFIVIFGFLFWYISHSEDTQNSRDFTTDGYSYPPKPPLCSTSRYKDPQVKQSGKVYAKRTFRGT